MRSVTAASAVFRSRATALAGLVTALMLAGTAQANAATLADDLDSSSGIGGTVGIVTVGLGVIGLVFGILRRRRSVATQSAAPVREHTTIAAPTPAETTGGWATEPLALPTRTVRAHQQNRPQARPAPRIPAGQRLTTR